METIQGLNELIKNRLIEKKGNVKLTENTDIILYGRALGFNENQLLFKVLEIEETIDWAKEKENDLNTDTFIAPNKASSINNVIYCSNCNAANEKGVANFCINCGKEINKTSVTNQKAVPQQNSIIKKNKTPLLIGILLLIIIGGGILYFLNQVSPQIGIQNTGKNDTIVGRELKEDTIAVGIEFQKKPFKNTSDFEYTTFYSKLSRYKFIYVGEKWAYCNKDKYSMMNFNKRILDNFDLSMEEKKSFVENLESISGHEILDRIENINNSYDSISNIADEIDYKKRKEKNTPRPKPAPIKNKKSNNEELLEE